MEITYLSTMTPMKTIPTATDLHLVSADIFVFSVYVFTMFSTFAGKILDCNLAKPNVQWLDGVTEIIGRNNMRRAPDIRDMITAENKTYTVLAYTNDGVSVKIKQAKRKSPDSPTKERVQHTWKYSTQGSPTEPSREIETTIWIPGPACLTRLCKS